MRAKPNNVKYMHQFGQTYTNSYSCIQWQGKQAILRNLLREAKII